MFGFEKKNPSSFKRNFLRTVIFQVKFSENQSIESNKQDVIELFQKDFPKKLSLVGDGFEIIFDRNKTPLVQKFQDQKGVELRSLDGKRALSINTNTFTYTIAGNVYKNYNQLKEDLILLDVFLKKFNISTVNRVAIRKLNIIDFKAGKNPISGLKHLINPDLLANLSYFPSSDKISQNFQNVNYVQDPFQLNLKYGMNMLPKSIDGDNFGQVIIDIDLFRIGEMTSQNMFQVTDEINSEIFNVFNWVISENALKILNND